ncbi:hypothetical protein KKH27_05645 [bacterium]|nr:hypothetical protein [bacterium]MBU1984519.1 hypothetical protein [bacterium]
MLIAEARVFRFSRARLRRLWAGQAKKQDACRRAHSEEIRCRLREGHIGEKHGWLRVSLGPTVSEEEFQTLLEGIDYVARHGKEYEDRYELSDETGEWTWNEGMKDEG